jgi:hypothetical protein
LLQLKIGNEWLLRGADDAKAFFRGLALNRSIQALQIDFEFDDAINSLIEQLFEAVLPLFQFNNNLKVFDVRSGISCIYKLYQGCATCLLIR